MTPDLSTYINFLSANDFLVACQTGDLENVKLNIPSDISTRYYGITLAIVGNQTHIIDFLISEGCSGWINTFIRLFEIKYSMNLEITKINSKGIMSMVKYINRRNLFKFYRIELPEDIKSIIYSYLILK